MSSVLTIAKALIALADVIPFARMLFDQITDLWLERNLKGVENAKIDKQKKRKALIKALKMEGVTNEDRMAYSVMLHDLNK
jgi:hypothetical protein